MPPKRSALASNTTPSAAPIEAENGNWKMEKGTTEDGDATARPSFRFLFSLFHCGLCELLAEVIERELQALVEADLWLPVQQALCLGDVWAAALGVVHRQRLENNF